MALCSNLRLPIHLAAMHGHGDMVLLLLEAAPNPVAAATCPDASCPGPLYHLLQYEHRQPDCAPLHTAAAMQRLLQLAPQSAEHTNLFGCTALHLAVSQDRLAEIALLLLAAGPGAASQANWQEELPLHCAACTSPPVLQQLLAVNPAAALHRTVADPHALGEPNNEVPLHFFACLATPHMLGILLAAAPAAAKAQDSQGHTPLQVALEAGRPDNASLLLASTPTQLALAALVGAGPAAAPLWPEFVSRQPLSAEQWQQVPHSSALGATLLAVLARSEAEAGELVRRLPYVQRRQLRAAARVLSRLPLPASVQRAILCRILR